MKITEVNWMVEWFADLLRENASIEIDNAKKEDLRSIIAGLPKEASLGDLINAIKDYETEQNAINRIGFVMEIIVNQPIDIENKRKVLFQSEDEI
ncbi:hypothetical protein LA938_004191 [Salmonella enterica subsp. enterica serovar Mikawasima]|nr:hypothetical protein [Salmonella enterica subsp. enterica serovar Mikawasima]EID1820585.1 hypothetical protein [Salmonella enterica subsp. enterica serovar Mikawasima]